MLVLQAGELLSLISRTHLFRETGQCAWAVKMNMALGCDARQAPLALSLRLEQALSHKLQPSGACTLQWGKWHIPEDKDSVNNVEQVDRCMHIRKTACPWASLQSTSLSDLGLFETMSLMVVAFLKQSEYIPNSLNIHSRYCPKQLL